MMPYFVCKRGCNYNRMMSAIEADKRALDRNGVAAQIEAEHLKADSHGILMNRKSAPRFDARSEYSLIEPIPSATSFRRGHALRFPKLIISRTSARLRVLRSATR